MTRSVVVETCPHDCARCKEFEEGFRGRGRKQTVGAGKCPHGCSRCKAIEAGVGGRGLTQKDFMRVIGLAERPPKDTPDWAADTVEAQLAAEVAQFAADDAQRLWRDVYYAAETEKDSLRNDPGTALSPTEEFQLRRRFREVEDAVAAAHEEFDDARKRLAAAKRRLRELEERDRRVHRHEKWLAMQRELAEQAAAAREAKSRTRKSSLRRLMERR